MAPLSDLEEQKELSIDTEEGLREFLGYANDAFFEVVDLLKSIDRSSTPSAIDSEALKAVHEEICDVIDRCLEDIQYGNVVDETDVLMLQDLYNELITARDVLEEMGGKLPPAAPVEKAPEIQHPKLTPVPVKKSLQTLLPGKEVKSDLSGSIAAALVDRRYQAIVSERFGSAVAFEAMLRREIARVEQPSKLDRVLGIIYNSAFFSFLKDKTLEELDEFDEQPPVVIRQILEDKNIQYDVYVNWMQGLSSMRRLVQTHQQMKFGELLVRSELELLKQHAE